MNKLTKLLSVFVIAGALGAGVAGAVGCNKGGGSGSGGHQHNYSWVDDHNGQCHEHCDVAGCDTPDKPAQDHIWGNDNVCDNCQAVHIAVESVAIDGENLEVVVGETLQLAATVTPSNATASVTWSIVTGADKAEIDPATGALTGVAAGLVKVKATADGKTAEKYVTVKAIALTNVTLAKKSLALKPGEDYTLTPVFTPANATNKKITWSTSDATVATVNADGKVTAVADGSATITGVSEDGNKEVTCAVEVDHSFIDVNYEVNISEGFAAGNAGDRTSGFVTLKDKTNVRGRTPSNKTVFANEQGGGAVKTLEEMEYTKSVQFDGNAVVELDIPAAGTLTIHTQNSSSGVTEWQQMVMAKPNGTNENIKIAAFDSSPVREIVIELDEAGKYLLTRGGNSSSDMFYISYEGRVKDTPLEKIEVVGANTEFFVGQDFSSDKLVLQKVYEAPSPNLTGRTESLAGDADGVVVNHDNVNMNTAGTYTVNVTYTLDGTPFQTSYDVTVYAVEQLKIGKNATVKENSNSSAGNGVYANHHLRELYFAGDKLSTDGLTVTLTTSLGEGENKQVKEFILTGGYSLTIDGQPATGTLTAGKHSVTVTLDGTNVSEDFIVYVIDGIGDLSAATNVAVKVDAGTTDANVGVIAGGAYQFQTIHQALEFLENCKAPASASKVMTLAAGTYTEKLEVKVPNLTIIGAGTGESGYSMIEWDSLYGEVDESGYAQVTDSTATLNVRDSATGFTIRNVIISNWFNSADRFVERFGEDKAISGVDHRALAMLVQADKVRVENCSLLGYQDTLEVFTGRHVFENCLIVGVTDFIFGTNGTTYFTGCEIRSIKHVKDVVEENGQIKGQVGYLTAMKGNNKGTTKDKVTYGIIFDDCDFTAESGVTSGWAIGRTWGVDSAVMIMNSRIGGHIATDSNRYVGMSGNPENAQFTEYNNTGAGAVATPVKIGEKNLWNVPEQTEAEKYIKFEVIFGKTNGQVTYADTWDGQAGAKITSATYDLRPYAGDELSNGATGQFAGVSINATSGKFEAHSQDSVHITAGLVLTIPMDKRYKVTFTWYGGDDTYADKNMKVDYLEDNGAVTALQLTFVDKQCYLCTIVVDMSVEMRTLTIKDKDTDEVIGTKLVEEGEGVTTELISAIVTGNAQYSSSELDKVYVADKTTEYAGAAIDGDTTLYVTTVDADIIYDESQTVKLIDGELVCPNVNAGETNKFKGIEINGGTGSFTINGSKDWMYLTPGATIKIKVAAGATVTVTEHNTTAGNAKASERDADGWVTISTETATYINAISVAYDHIYGVGENINLEVSATPVIDGVTISGTCRANGNSVQVGTNTVIRIKAQQGTWVKINWYPNANANDNNATVSYDTTTGELVIAVKESADGAPADSIYIISIDIIAEE